MRGTIAGTLLAVAIAACGDNAGSDVPEIAGARLTTDEDEPVSLAVQASDSAGRALTLRADAPMHGNVVVDRLRVTYLPAANYHGPDSFTVTVSNGKGEASAQIDVEVGSVNDAPAAIPDAFAASEDTPLVRPFSALLANDGDADGDTLSVMAVGSPVHGTVSAVGTTVTFTPAPDFTGMASFEYTVGDGAAAAMATVAISVGGVNDAPAAADDTAAAQEDTPLELAATMLVANDTDVEGQTLTVTAVGNATNGAVALDTGTGTVTFTPAAGFLGAAAFDYVVSDGTDTDVATVTVTVTPVCGNGVISGPETCDDGNSTGGDGCSATCQRERLEIFTFTGAAGDEVSFPADGPAPAPGLGAIPVISRGSGLARAAAPDEFSSEVWQLGPAIDLTDYYTFTVTPAAGFTVSLLGIELDERRSASGPLFWAVRSSLDGFTTDVAMFALPDDTNYRRDQLVPLGPAFRNLATPVELRIYGWDAEGSLGTWRLDNIEIFGFTTGP